jgi:hypothetical protein
MFMISESYEMFYFTQSNLEHDDRKTYFIVPDYRENPYASIAVLAKRFPGWCIFYHSWGTVVGKPIPLPIEVLEVSLHKNEPSGLMFLYARYI